MARNFCRTKFLFFFHRLVSDHENFNHEIYSQCKPQPFLTVGVAYFRSVIIESLTSVCAMAMYHSVDKLPKLPDPTGSLSMKVSSSSNVLANAGVKSVLEESVGEGKQDCYVKLSSTVDDGYPALFDMAAPRQRLHPRYLHKCGTHAPSLQHSTRSPSLQFQLKKFAHVMWLWLAYTQYGRGFAMVEPRKFFCEIIDNTAWPWM